METYQLTIHLESILRSSTPPPCAKSTFLTSAVTRGSSPGTGCAYRSHTTTVQSLEPLTIKPLRGARESTPSTSSSRMSQSRSNLRHKTEPRWPAKVARHLPVFRLHTLIVRSREPVTMRDESNSKQYTLRDE